MAEVSQDLERRLRILMLLRVIFATILLGATVIFNIKSSPVSSHVIHKAHYFLIAGIYGLTGLYLVLFKLSRRLVPMAYIQIMGDCLSITAVLYVTGGIESIFSFLFILNIIAGSTILYRKGGLLTASASSICYGLVIDLHFYGVIRPLSIEGGAIAQYHPFYAIYLISVHIAAFYLVALLTSYLSEQLRKSASALKEKELDFDRLESLHESIIKSMSSGLVVLDQQGRSVLSNPAAKAILRDLGGELGPESFLKTCLEAARKEPTHGASMEVKDITLTRKDGKTLHLRVNMSDLRALRGGDVKGHILIFQDVTELKRIEEAIKRVEGLAMIGELAASIAHEIKNPLASISGSFQILRHKLGNDSTGLRLMEIVGREIDRLNNLLNDFLLFARPKKISSQRLDLERHLMESLDLFRNTNNWKEDVKIKTRFHPFLHVVADPALLRQVLWNIFLNSAEAMEEGGLLYISTEFIEGEAPKAKITVRDTGPGFHPNALAQLFVPFFTTKQRGSGLGLAIVRRLVEEMKGEVKGGNHPDGGAEITIILPAALEREERVFSKETQMDIPAMMKPAAEAQ
jgi:two-component system sensor histidine kinase PilS (NtrC family)